MTNSGAQPTHSSLHDPLHTLRLPREEIRQEKIYTSHNCTAKFRARKVVAPDGRRGYEPSQYSIPPVDHGLITIEIETVERAATHSSIMFRSTRLGASSERDSGWLDSLAG